MKWIFEFWKPSFCVTIHKFTTCRFQDLKIWNVAHVLLEYAWIAIAVDCNLEIMTITFLITVDNKVTDILFIFVAFIDIVKGRGEH